MRSEEIKIELGEGVEYATDQEMESRNVNNFQGFPIAASTVVVFPEDEIKKPKIAIRVRPNKELEARILSYGPQVEVLSPGWYRDAIALKIKENYAKYFPVHNLCTDNY